MLTQTLRALRRAPAFSAIAILSLGLAVAVNTSLFGFVDALVNPREPYANTGSVYSTYTIGGDRRVQIPPDAEERALRGGLQSASENASFLTFSAMVVGGSGGEDRLVVGASPNLFELLGVQPEVGQSLAALDATQNGAIISHTLWEQWFQRQPLANGLKLRIGSRTFAVAGVMPAGVHFPLLASAWIPAASMPAEVREKKPHAEIAFRLKPGAIVETARRELNASLQRVADDYGQRNAAGAVLVPLHVRRLPFTNYRLAMVVAGLVLLIGGANLGTMMLARGYARRREVAIRIALGASRRAISAEVFTECAVIVAMGLSLALLLTLWAMDVVPHLVAGQLPVLGDVQPRLSWRVFTFASVAAALIVLVAGWLPAARSAGTDPSEAMKDGGATTDRIRDRYNPLLIVEVALSVGLLTTAGLFAQYSAKLASFNFAYEADRLVKAQVKAPASNVPASDLPQFYTDALLRLRGIPGVEAAATRYYVAADHGVVTAEGGATGERWINVSRVAVVSPDYLRTLGIGITQGRDFDAGDQTGAAGVIIVDQAAVRAFWPTDSNATGHQLKLGAADSRAPWLRVVGVARGVELEPRSDPDLPPEPQVYLVLPNDRESSREIVVRGADVARGALALSVRQELQVIAPWLGSASVTRWLDRYDNSVTSSAFLAATFAAFGAFGLALCAVGLFGVTGYTVSRRTREFALRIALGAGTNRIARAVLHDAAVTILAGVGLGALGTLWATREVRESLASGGTQLLVALLAAECALLVAAIAASYRPLVRATRADPVQLLRAN